MGIELSDDVIPLRRPQFELRSNALFFLLSTRAHAKCSSEEAALWTKLDGVATVRDLRESFRDSDSSLRRFWELGTCELAPSRFPAHRRRVLVVEPHMDDAVLSVGATMWTLRAKCEFTVVSVAGRSNFTSYYFLEREFFDVAKVSELRRLESALVMRLLGGRHVMLNELDAPLRYQSGNWSLDWFRQNARSISGFVGHCYTDCEMESWTSAIERCLLQAEVEEVWLPLGVSRHTDHELARDACLRAVARLPFERRRALCLYQDVPHALHSRTHTDRILNALIEAGAALEPWESDIGEALADKLRLSSVFGSQFKMTYMAPRIQEAARRASRSRTGSSELLFRVTKAPGPVEPLAVYSGRGVVLNLVPRLVRWRRRHRLARRIRILSPAPVGRWEEDVSCLLEAFPETTFEVHIGDASASEFVRLLSPRIEIVGVRGRKRAWIRRLLRVALARPCPLILLTGEDRQIVAQCARMVCVLSDSLSATSMNYLVRALRAAQSLTDEGARLVSVGS